MGLRTDVGITHQVRGSGALAHSFLLLSCALPSIHTYAHAHPSHSSEAGSWRLGFSPAEARWAVWCNGENPRLGLQKPGPSPCFSATLGIHPFTSLNFTFLSNKKKD